MTNISFDNVMVEDRFCKQFFALRHCCHLAPKTNAISLEFGIALHKGLQTYRESGDVQLAIETANKLPLTEPNPTRNSSTLCELLQRYAIAFPLNLDPLQPLILANGSRALEISLTIQLPSPTGCTYVMNVDELAKHSADGTLWVIDHKSTWRLTQLEIFGWQMRTQFAAYALGSSIYLDQVVNRCMVNAFIMQRKLELERVPFVFSREQLERTGHLLRLYAADIASIYSSLGYEGEAMPISAVLDHPACPPNRCGCCNYMKRCRYGDICQYKNTDTSAFDIKKWDPLNREGQND